MKTNKNFEHEELQNRIDLAAAYHLADLYGFSDIIWNHITCKTSSKKNTFLINNFGLRYDEVTSTNLLEIDLLNTKQDTIKPSQNLLEYAAGQYDDPKYQLGKHEWPALKRMLDKNNSIYDQ